jgi:hypothetical protein
MDISDVRETGETMVDSTSAVGIQMDVTRFLIVRVER